MHYLKRYLPVIIAGLLLAGGVVMVNADMASPRAQWTTVRMESETVDVVLGEKRVEVTAVFHFRNNGPAAAVPMGYPLGVLESALNEFKVFVDDKEIKNIRTMDKKAQQPADDPEEVDSNAYRFEGPYKQWKVVDVQMGENEKKIVKVTYWVAPAKVKTAEIQNVSHYAYTLLTGATWKGKIDEAIVRVKLKDIKPANVVQATPGKYEKSADSMTYTWTFKDFKPSENVELTFKTNAEAAEKN
jgi:hypothetical protein